MARLSREGLRRKWGIGAASEATPASHEALGTIHGGFPSRVVDQAVDESLAALEPGTRIGPYQLLEKIGEGGMAWSTWPSRPVRSNGRWPSS